MRSSGVLGSNCGARKPQEEGSLLWLGQRWVACVQWGRLETSTVHQHFEL